MRDQPDGQLEIGLEYNRGKNKQKQIVSHTSMSLTFVTGPSWKNRSNPLWVDDWRQRFFLCVFPFERPSCDLTREIQTVVNHQNSRSFPFFFFLFTCKTQEAYGSGGAWQTAHFLEKYNRIKVLVCYFHGQPNTTRKPPNVQIPIAGLEGWGNLPSAIILLILFFIFKNSP